ncbi:hypothetical protein CLOAM0125 [Candidatus Cloacimonas acidaminovorans str. Evry]|uniref:Uncharacterized protein n=1 Tax=Cloacimonas acidaminovorans (strain Evry) TaxID=459349 RepID=B0VIX5_CLOAI|nr:hypothetical protein CLOAM0125 [Candidatus Cloacimonas acidaminovorans str. Evry]
MEIKLLGFEIPLGATIKNQCFIDLLAMDQDSNIYIIENSIRLEQFMF